MKKQKRVTLKDIHAKKTAGENITMLTAYDSLFARIIDGSGIDIILVGDSLGMVGLGFTNTIPVTLDMMVHHTRAVTRVTRHAFVISDMPFLTVQTSVRDAMKNAGRLFQEGRTQAVKIEGADANTIKSIKNITEAGMPVMGHIGLTPQSIHAIGGYDVQGIKPEEQQGLKDSANKLIDAGVFSIILETVPQKLAEEITAQVPVPVIGIGAGPDTDGQVLVTADMLGLFRRFRPSFVKPYENLFEKSEDAIKKFIEEVKTRKFPDDEHSF